MRLLDDAEERELNFQEDAMGIVVIGAIFVDIKGYPYDTYLPTGRNSGRIVQVHGGVSRNIAEDIANVELRPTFVSLVDDTGMGIDVIEKLKRHKVNTKYIRKVPDGMGAWLAIFDNEGDVAGSISKRPNLEPIAQILKEEGDEIIKDCDSIVVEFDLENSVLKQVFEAGICPRREIPQGCVRSRIQHVDRDEAARPAAENPLLCVQQGGGGGILRGFLQRDPE